MYEGTWTLRPCPHGVQVRLAQALEISELTAGVLVRRGYTDPDVARAFIAGEWLSHDPFLLGDMAVAVERIRAAIADGRRICVHGDYDVDGISATALICAISSRPNAAMHHAIPERSMSWPVSRSSGRRTASSRRESDA